MKWAAISLLLVGGCIKGIGQPDHDKVEIESQMRPETIAKLREDGILISDEQLLCHYHRSVGDRTFLLTDQRVVEHGSDGMKSIPISEITAVTHIQTSLGRVTTVHGRRGVQIMYAIYDINGGGFWKETLDRLWAQEQVRRAVKQ
jgi:hypothetical protein